MQRLVEAERAQTALSNTSMATMNNGGTATESEILLFRNQLKVETNIAHHHALQRKPREREKRKCERESCLDIASFQNGTGLLMH